ncbi:MAG: hypothetical protein LBU23_02320 [Planctomycetota bacterium]|jgi:TRAP-type C4-dicarboxylate transport system permease large subunit|nr:hypothetical protein [Planctomycetota bacterium]
MFPFDGDLPPRRLRKWLRCQRRSWRVGLIAAAGLAIGMSAPPAGLTPFAAAGIAGAPGRIRPLVPFWILTSIFPLALTCPPGLTLFLPGPMN